MSITGFDVKQLGQNAIGDVGAVLAPLSSYSFMVDASTNRTVEVPVIGAMPDATDFAENNNYITENGTTATTVPVVVNKLKKGTFKLTKQNRRALNDASIQALWAEAIKAAIRAANADIMSAITATNFSTVQTTALVDMDLTAHGVLRNTLENLIGASPDARFTTVLSPAYYDALRLDPDLRQLFSAAGVVSPVTGAMVPMLDNCEIIKAVVPSNSQNLVGFITDRSGIAVGYLAQEDYESAIASVDNVTDPVTGITVALREEVKNGTDDIFCSAIVEYGYRNVYSKGIVRLRSAA